MHCGLDFGTTNSSMTYVRNGSLEFAELAKDKKAVPTAAWFEGTKKNVSEVTDQEISIAYNKRFGQPKLGIAGDTLRKRRGYIKEELLRERNKDKSLRLTSIHDSSSVSIGFDALEHFENYDDGLLIKSPKAVIGSNLSTAQAVAFESIIERMLVQYRASAEVNSRLFFDSLVLGRPITWGINSSKVKERYSHFWCMTI